MNRQRVETSRVEEEKRKNKKRKRRNTNGFAPLDHFDPMIDINPYELYIDYQKVYFYYF